MTYNTEKRADILEFLSKSDGKPYTIDEICSRVLNEGQGKSTVYRLISKMVDEGKIRRISDGKTRKVTYQYIGAGRCRNHLHLKCNSCGGLIHLDDLTSHILESRIFTAEGFELDSGALIYGRCKSCLGNTKKGNEIKI